MLQRLSEPYIFDEVGGCYVPIGWLKSFEFAKNSLFEFPAEEHIDVVRFGSGSFLDLETAYSLKQFVSSYGFRCGLDIALGNIKNSDSRMNYILKIEQFEPDYLKTRNIGLVNLNLRYESPLLNIQVRAQQQEHELEVFVLGFLSNTNFSFLHIGTQFTRRGLQFFEKNSDTLLIVGGQHRELAYINPDFIKTNYVWTQISQLSCLELLPISKNILCKHFFGVNAGVLRPELPVLMDNSFISVNFVHHMVDDYIPFSEAAIFWPTKFYLEKVASFFGNVGHFFSTVINIFGFNIRGTKEEHRILNALDELMGGSLNKTTFETINPSKIGINEKPTPFILTKKPTGLFLQRRLPRSLINNYYLTNEVTEASPVLGLCAKRYGVMNDYL